MISIELSNGNLRLLLSTPDERKCLSKPVSGASDKHYAEDLMAIMGYIEESYPCINIMDDEDSEMMPDAKELNDSPILLYKSEESELILDQMDTRNDFLKTRLAYEAVVEGRDLVVDPDAETVYEERKTVRTEYGPMYLEGGRKLVNPFKHVWYCDSTFVTELIENGFCDFKKWC